MARARPGVLHHWPDMRITNEDEMQVATSISMYLNHRKHNTCFHGLLFNCIPAEVDNDWIMLLVFAFTEDLHSTPSNVRPVHECKEALEFKSWAFSLSGDEELTPKSKRISVADPFMDY